MARSVSTPSNCAAICYRDVSGIEDGWEWSDFKEMLADQVKELFPSIDECDTWLDREDHAFMENNFAYIGISEYCGLAAIWLKSKSEYYECSCYPDELRLANLADNWCQRIVPKFESNFSEYKRVATASNGESFYEKIA